MTIERFDVAIVGGGIAGASAAYFLSKRQSVVLLEQESAPGYHATGRSAALYTQAYGPPPVRALTVASKPFFDAPPEGFASSPLLRPRGALFIAREDQIETLAKETAAAQQFAPAVRALNPSEAKKLMPALRTGYVAGAALEPDAADIEVDLLLQGFVRGSRANGADLRTDSALKDLIQENDGWRLETSKGALRANVVVNAAGAWASQVARMAGAAKVEIQPKRRTAFLFRPPEGQDFSASPMTIDVDEQFYIKPDAGLLLGSPADETPSEPMDAQPEELDIAIGADRIQQAANLPIRRIEHSWAGLRSFSPDKTPVVGFDDAAPGFFWLAGQGGYGVQTSPAMGAYAAALIQGEPAADGLADLDLSPTRFSSSAARG